MPVPRKIAGMGLARDLFGSTAHRNVSEPPQLTAKIVGRLPVGVLGARCVMFFFCMPDEPVPWILRCSQKICFADFGNTCGCVWPCSLRMD